jgi:hypothetical protein
VARWQFFFFSLGNSKGWQTAQEAGPGQRPEDFEDWAEISQLTPGKRYDKRSINQPL